MPARYKQIRDKRLLQELRGPAARLGRACAWSAHFQPEAWRIFDCPVQLTTFPAGSSRTISPIVARCNDTEHRKLPTVGGQGERPHSLQSRQNAEFGCTKRHRYWFSGRTHRM